MSPVPPRAAPGTWLIRLSLLLLLLSLLSVAALSWPSTRLVLSNWVDGWGDAAEGGAQGDIEEGAEDVARELALSGDGVADQVLVALGGTLSQWLARGRSTEAIAPLAQAVADVAAAAEPDPDEIAARFSELDTALARIHRHTPEVTGLMQELRARIPVSGLDANTGADMAAELGATTSAHTPWASWVRNGPGGHVAPLQRLTLAVAGMAMLGLLYGFWRQGVHWRRGLSSAALAERSASQDNGTDVDWKRITDSARRWQQLDLRSGVGPHTALPAEVAVTLDKALHRWCDMAGASRDAMANLGRQANQGQEAQQRLLHDHEVLGREIQHSSDQVKSLGSAMAGLSADAGRSVRIAGHAVAHANAATQAVQSSVAGLEQVLAHSEETQKRMRQLELQSHAVVEGLQRLRDVARRTDLLAVNTTIRAGSGEHLSNDDMAELADEVTQLSEALQDSCHEVGEVLERICEGAGKTGESIRYTGLQMRQGTRQARQANDCLAAIDSVAHELQELVGRMATETREQGAGVSRLAARFGTVDELLQRTRDGLRGMGRSWRELRTVAIGLRDSTTGVRLPGDTDTSQAKGAAALPVPRQAEPLGSDD